MKIFTIGFTQTSAEDCFTRLKRSGAKTLIDVRLNNVSQLAGFAKKGDLRYFVENLCGMGYTHIPALAPTKDILDEYKKNGGEWDVYVQQFLSLMAKRRIEDLDKSQLDEGCLLCSEYKPHYCHRRLVAEYLLEKWSDVEIKHL